MAQDGDTITYNFNDNTDSNNDLIPQQEDVSAVDTATVVYMDGAGGSNNTTTGGNGGRVESAEIDVSGQDTLYIWVATSEFLGRYDGDFVTSGGGGSTELSFSNTQQGDSADEPFLVAAGGGGAGWAVVNTGFGTFEGAGGGARGGATGNSSGTGGGVAPPLGGDGAPDSSSTGSDGAGAIDDQNRGLVSGGTTITGGGSGPGTNGEVRITYGQTLSPPDPPSNLSAEAQ